MDDWAPPPDAAPPGELPPGTVAVLQHPGGGKCYLVAVAHVSRQSADDAAAAIAAVAPAAVVLELDPGRLAALRADAGAERRGGGGADPYGLAKFAPASKLSLAATALAGRAPQFLLGLTYAVAGAVVGARAGGEFLAAADAAAGVGAAIVPGDRDQRVTLQRLLAASRAASAAARGPASGMEGGPGLSGDSVPGLGRPLEVPVFAGGGGRDGGGLPRAEREEEEEVGSADGRDDPFLLAPDADGADTAAASPSSSTPSSREARFRSFLAANGCANADAAVAAFSRALALGSRGGRIDVADLAELRSCGRGVVETTRAAAAAGGGGASALRRLEHAAAAEAAAAGGAALPPPALRVMDAVLGAERDVVLARSLWATAASVPGADVVGVVGAAHVAGVARLWRAAGDPAFAARADALCRPPPGATTGGPAGAVPALVAGGLLATLSLRRPKVALYVVGSAALLATPFAVAAANTMDRFARLGRAVGEAAAQLDSEEGGTAAPW